MRICLFHPKRLPPRDYGGVERVVVWLAKGLQERGHEVSVAALRGSRLPVGIRLIEMDPGVTSAEALLKVLPEGLDAVHFMAPPEAGAWERLPCAGLLTVHGNGKPGEVFPLNTVFLSADHARRHGGHAFVHNGIDPAEYQFDPDRAQADWMLFLSKTSWSVKNARGAARICRRAGASLVVAGGNRPWGLRARASLSKGLRWEGPVAGSRKAALLADARALLFPVLWPEPFGLVVVEAMMSGTPVLASRVGSLPELVISEVGELLDIPTSASAEAIWVDRVRELACLPRRKMPWEPEACRQWAEGRFHYLKMAEAYENAYKRVARGERLHGRPPVTGG